MELDPVYLKSAHYINSGAQTLIQQAQSVINQAIFVQNPDSAPDPIPEPDEISKAIALYLYVRDQWRYDPYDLVLDPAKLKASDILERNAGNCCEKAILLAGLARAAGIPARLGFARVYNHLGTARLEELLKTNLMVFHGFTELYLNEKWVKATPAFNKDLCEKLNVNPLEFNGLEDSIFQEYDRGEGKQFMEYVHDYGTFSDFPYTYFMEELMSHYPHVFEDKMEIVRGYLETAAKQEILTK